MKVAIADANPGHQAVKRSGVGHRLLGRSHHWLGHNLEKRRAGAIEVDARAIRGQAIECLMHGLARILLEVCPSELNDPLTAVCKGHGKAPSLDHRNFVLTDLIGLGQVWVEVMLASKHGARRDSSADGQTKTYCRLNRGAVHHGQDPWQRHIHRMGLAVGLLTETRCSTRKYFGGRLQLHMGL